MAKNELKNSLLGIAYYQQGKITVVFYYVEKKLKIMQDLVIILLLLM